MSDVIEIAIPTWNRAASVVVAVRSALAQQVDGLIVRVYDNGSVDDTSAVLASEFGERIDVVSWPENRGQAANMTRILATESDYLLVLFDDEVLAPGAVQRLVDALRERPSATLAYGSVTIRDWQHRELRTDCLFGRDAGLEPPIRSGADYIDGVLTMGSPVWICAAMFAMRRTTRLSFTDRYSPQADAVLFMQAALDGDVVFVGSAVATRTDGMPSEGSVTGQIAGVDDRGFDIPSTIGVLHLQLAFTRFLHTEYGPRLTPRRRSALQRSIHRYASCYLADALVAQVQGPTSVIRMWPKIIDAAPLLATARAKLALPIDVRRSIRARAAEQAA